MWEALIPIIAQYGLPLATKLVEKWSTGTAPTLEDFAELNQLAQSNATDEAKKVLTQQGIPLDSPQGKAILSLVAG